MPQRSELDTKYLEASLTSCKLCEWYCEVNRLEGEIGVCGITIPEVASSQLHPAPPASFDAFLTGCSFRCLSCQNWPVANYPANNYYGVIEGYYEPFAWAELAVGAMNSSAAHRIGADRLFFTGGEPTCSLPWVEAVIESARKLQPGIKVNFDTNGYMTKDSLNRILSFTNSITFDLKAYDPDLFRALTGAEVEPVIRNLEHIVQRAPEKLWEVRVLVIPHLHDRDIEGLCNFLAGLDENLPLNFLAFRPNFVMNEHSWTSRKFMEQCILTAKKAGMRNTSWSGRTVEKSRSSSKQTDKPPSIAAMDYAHSAGCIQTEKRSCGSCSSVNKCSVKRFQTEDMN
jgi:pyruvate-formate lyase-activating enzyme